MARSDNRRHSFVSRAKSMGNGAETRHNSGPILTPAEIYFELCYNDLFAVYS